MTQKTSGVTQKTSDVTRKASDGSPDPDVDQPSGQRRDQLPAYNPRDPQTINNPIPALRKLQDLDPVHWSDTLRGWVITRYADAKTVLRNDNFSADRITPFYQSLTPERQQPISELIRYLNTWVAFKDPPSTPDCASLCGPSSPPTLSLRWTASSSVPWTN